MPMIWEIVLGTVPLIIAVLGTAMHLGIRIGRFQQLIEAMGDTQTAIRRDLEAHILLDEKSFAELQVALRAYADSLNRLVGAVTGRVP